MVKILIVGPMNLPIPSEKGAVEEIIWQSSRRLKSYFNISIYNPTASSSIQKIIKGLILKIQNNVPDCDDVIIHSHSIYASLGINSINSYKCSIKHFLTVHTLPWKWFQNINGIKIKMSSSRKYAIALFFLKELIKSGTILISPSIYLAKRLSKSGCTKVIYVPNGVDVEAFNPRLRSEEIRKNLKAKNKILITYVGRLHPEKNQLILLKALKNIINEFKDLKIVFVGPYSGSFKKEGYNSYYQLLLQYIQKYNLNTYVNFLGELPRKKIAKILASSDIYVHPSINEVATPLAVLEAMASGVPILVFDFPFYKGYLYHEYNAILTKPNDKKLGNAILSLIYDKKLREKISYNALKTAREHFSWDKIIKKYYLKIYSNIPK